MVKTLKKTAQLPGIQQFTSDQIWSAIEAHRTGGTDVGQSDLKEPEWQVLTADDPPTDYPHFMSNKVGVPKGFENGDHARLAVGAAARSECLARFHARRVPR